MTRPHRLLHRILSFVLPRAWADDALGDLREEYLEWREAHGSAAAAVRLVRRTAGLVAYGLLDRLRHAPQSLAGLRGAIRKPLRRPAITVVAALSLGPVLGAAGAFGSVLSSVFLGSLPQEDPHRLVIVSHEGADLREGRQSHLLHEWYATSTPSVESIGLFHHDGANVVFPGGARRVPVVRATASALRVVGASAEVGRLFRSEDDRESAPARVLVTRATWLERWGGDPSVVGRGVEVDGRLREIVGVLADEVRLPGPRPDLVLSAELDDVPPAATLLTWTASVARLAEGATPDQVSTEIEAAFRRGARGDQRLAAASAAPGGIEPRVLPVRRWHARQVTPILAVGFGSSVVLLVLTGAAVLTLLLSGLEAWGRESRIRTALGATRSGLRVQAAVESMAVLAGAYAVGAITAGAAVRGLGRAIAVPIEGWADPVAAASFALLFGLCIVPLVAVIRGRSAERSRTCTHRRARSGGGPFLLGAQVAGAVVLGTALAASARSAWTVTHRDLGFRAAGLLTFGVVLPEQPYGTDGASSFELHETVKVHLARLPGVETAAYGLGTPVAHPGWTRPWEVERAGTAAVPESRRYRAVSLGYFDGLDIPLRAGRTFRSADFAAPPRVVVVNEAFVLLYWKDPADALHQRIRPTGSAEWSKIIGVVGNTADQGAAEAPAPMIYRPLSVAAPPQELRFVQYVMRGSTSTAAILPAVRKIFADLDPSIPAFAFDTGEDLVRRDIVRERMSFAFLTGAAAVGLLVAALGLAGLVLLTIMSRSREIGVRKALGGSDAALRRHSLASVRGPVLVGTSVGIALVWVGLRVPDALLHDAGGWGEHAGTALLVLVPVLTMTGYLGSRRVTCIDPSEALRE